MLNSYVFALYLAPYDGTGEGGIRTLGSLFGYGALARLRFTWEASILLTNT